MIEENLKVGDLCVFNEEHIGRISKIITNKYKNNIIKKYYFSNDNCHYLCKTIYPKIKNKEENKMDFIEKIDLKQFNKENLIKGKKEVEEKRRNYEIEKAAQEYERLINIKEKFEREIKTKEEELQKIKEELKVFKK